jgi:hypothetical protein
VRGRAAGGLSDADAHPRQRELREALRQPGDRRHRAPQRGAGRDHAAPHAAVGEARDRDAGEGVEHREGPAGEEAHRGVGDAEVALDGLQQDREDLAVDEVEDVDDEQQPEHPARAGGRGSGARAGALGARCRHARAQIPRFARMRSAGGSRFGTKAVPVMRSNASM